MTGIFPVFFGRVQRVSGCNIDNYINKTKIFFMPLQLYYAIAFDIDRKPYKYRKIDAAKLDQFEKFLRLAKYNKPTCIYVNYYSRDTKEFLFRHYLNN